MGAIVPVIVYATPYAFLGVGFLLDYLFPRKHPRKMEEVEYCDFYRGRWVFDVYHYPLYSPQTCPFISKQFDCQNNDRPDHDYIKYKWKPYSCSLPRFDGKNLLKRFEGKRIMFVGDSVGHNQWLSFICMLHSAVPRAEYELQTKGSLSTLTFTDYKVTVMFSRNDFLVDIIVGEKNERILKVDSIENVESAAWKDADVLVFNPWNEWLQVGNRQSWDIIKEANVRYENMDGLAAYEKALNTWVKWVNSSVDTQKTKIFFQGVSPDHFDSRDWANPNAKNCRKQTRPVLGHRYPGGPHPAEAVVEKALAKISKSVHLLNITALSQLRKDGHPSIYGSKDVDCTHWCLPGVPDAWNELLYASLLGC